MPAGVAPGTPAAELHVTEPAAVALLWHPAKRAHLRPFVGQAAGLAGAARLLGVQKTAMSYRIRRLADAPIASHEALFDDVDAGGQSQTRRALGRAVVPQDLAQVEVSGDLLRQDPPDGGRQRRRGKLVNQGNLGNGNHAVVRRYEQVRPRLRPADPRGAVCRPDLHRAGAG